jgi:hypothetical protein
VGWNGKQLIGVACNGNPPSNVACNATVYGNTWLCSQASGAALAGSLFECQPAGWVFVDDLGATVVVAPSGPTGASGAIGVAGPFDEGDSGDGVIIVNCSGQLPPKPCDSTRAGLLAICVDQNRTLFACTLSSRRQGQFAWQRLGEVIAERHATDWFIPLMILTIATIVLIILIIITLCFMREYRREVMDMEERVQELTQRGDLKYKNANAPENMIFMTSNQAYDGIEKGAPVKWSARNDAVFGRTRMSEAERAKLERDRRLLQDDAGDAVEADTDTPKPVITRVGTAEQPVANYDRYGKK